MHHPGCCLTHQPGISSSITNTTHFSTPSTLPTLAHRPFNPCWCTTHATHAGTSFQNAAHVTHAGTSPALVRHPSQHSTNANTKPSLECFPHKHATHFTHTSRNATPFLKLLGFQLSFKTFLYCIVLYCIVNLFSVGNRNSSDT